MTEALRTVYDLSLSQSVQLGGGFLPPRRHEDGYESDAQYLADAKSFWRGFDDALAQAGIRDNRMLGGFLPEAFEQAWSEYCRINVRARR